MKQALDKFDGFLCDILKYQHLYNLPTTNAVVLNDVLQFMLIFIYHALEKYANV
jgi:hypothetical protein